MLTEMDPAVLNGFGRLRGRRLHPLQATLHGAYMAPRQPSQGGLDPFQSL
jgi:hypothetical protein